MFNRVCCECHNEISGIGVRLSGGEFVCYSCMKKAGLNPLIWTGGVVTSQGQFHQMILDNQRDINCQTIEDSVRKHKKPIIIVGGGLIRIDRNKRVFNYYKHGSVGKNIEVKFDDLLDFQVLANEELVFSGGSGKAFVGGFLFGPVGAVTGGVTAKRKGRKTVSDIKIKLIFKDIGRKVEYIPIHKMKITQNSGMYRQVSARLEEITAALMAILNDQREFANQNIQKSIRPITPPPLPIIPDKADRIKRIFELWQVGALTEEEFNQLKQEELGR